MVLVKSAAVNNGVWTPFNIGRDVQGSITEVMTVGGEVVERFRYDPWGVQMNGALADTCAVEAAADSLEVVVDSVMVDTLLVPEPWAMAGLSVYVGSHGYTGHEHLYGLGIINANARLYDPVVGRFLSPDPLIQDPESTQNFNRYSYCLNNPLKYTDESGEALVLSISRKGVTIGWNFYDIGVPVGLGISYDWSEPGGKIGGYVEVGIHSEIDIMGYNVTPTKNVTLKVAVYHSFQGNGSNSIEGSFTAKYGNKFFKLEAGGKVGVEFDNNWKRTKYAGSLNASAESNGAKIALDYTTSYDISNDSWDNSIGIGIKYGIKQFEGTSLQFDTSAEIKYTYNFNKRKGDLDYNVFVGNKESDKSVFSSEHFKLIAKYSSLVEDAQKNAKKKKDEYEKWRKKNKL